MSKPNRLILVQQIISKSTGFVPDIHPACANYASRMMRLIGVDIPVINYVPRLYDFCKRKASSPQPCDLIIFDRTYDAVSPGGIGYEDTMTHVGVVTDPAVKGFIHYSNSQGKAVQSNWDLWHDAYGSQVAGFLDFLEAGEEEQPVPDPGEEITIRLYFHDGKLSLKVGAELYDVQGINETLIKATRRK